MRKPRGQTSFKKKVALCGLGFFFVVLIIASFFGKRGWLEISRAKKRQLVLLERIQELEKKKQKLERDIQELKTNPEAYETKAREKLGLVKEDEIIVIDKKAP
ncbi:MAG: septum formation initiator family protein [Candidatus Aminicenantales bacterium]